MSVRSPLRGGRLGRVSTAGLLAILAACTPSTDPAQAIRTAPDRVRAAGSASVSLSMTRRAAGTPEAGTVEATSTARGSIDFGAKRGRMTLQVELPESLAGLTAITLQPCETVLDDTTVYLRAAESRRDAFDGRPWGKVAGSEVAGFDVQGFGAADPTGALDYLVGVEEVRELGAEQVDGVATVRYGADVDVDRLLERLPEDRREAVSAELGSSGAERLSVEVWLDEDDLPRRIRSEVRAATGAELTATVLLELSAFGRPVTVEVPADDQTAETTAGDATAACFGIPGGGL